jgi:anti-sigma regulatory factor (Ser/Thr protein kinase)
MSEHHQLSVYDDDGHLDALMGPYLQGGVDAREAVIAVVDQRKWGLLRERLGAAACESISYLDRDAVYTRPEDALFAYDARIRHLVRDGAPTVRVWGEFPVFASSEQSGPWIAYEAILNRAFAQHPVQLICGYDTREHSEAVLEGARHTHPFVRDKVWRENPHYHDPEQVVFAHTPGAEALPGLRALPPPADTATFRRTLLHEMTADDVPVDEARNVLIAAGEIFSNARRHGHGAGALRVGRVNGSFVCELADHGSGFHDPLAGYLPPRPGQAEGAGLWVVRQLTSRLEFVTTAQGFATRIWT